MSKRECFCGCDSFRFKIDMNEDPAWTYSNICNNCSHTLAEHCQEAIVRSKQAE
jgi:hypothetical protein